MKTEMIIREYIPQKSREDMENLLDAHISIWNYPENLKYLSYTQKPFETEILRKFFSNHVDRGVHYYVANGNNNISGIAVVGANSMEGFEIIGLGVHPDFKSKGIGAELIKYVLKVASDSNFKAVDTIVFADNTAMLRLLLAMSFVPVHMGYNLRADGADTLRMRRIL